MNLEDQQAEVLDRFERQAHRLTPELKQQFQVLIGQFADAYESEDDDQAADVLDEMRQQVEAFERKFQMIDRLRSLAGTGGQY